MISLALEPVVDFTVSSAYMLMLDCTRHCGRSLMYNTKSKGPKTEPWWAPEFSCRLDDNSLDFIKNEYTGSFGSVMFQFV